MSEAAGPPLLATLPGRLREWAFAAAGPPGSFAVHELASEPWPAVADGGRAVVLLDDPATAFADLLAMDAPTIYSASRVGAVLAVAHDRGTDGAPQLLFRDVKEDAVSLRRRLRAALDIVDQPAPLPDLPEPRAPAGRLAQDLVAGYLAPLRAHIAGAVPVELHWPRASFLLGDPPHDTATERIELAGPARCVVFGPYLCLPAGWWEAELRLYFSETACRRSFTVDMIAEDLVGTIRLRPAMAGVFRTRMTFHNPRADWQVALRIVLERGAIEGRIGLEGVTLRQSALKRATPGS